MSFCCRHHRCCCCYCFRFSFLYIKQIHQHLNDHPSIIANFSTKTKESILIFEFFFLQKRYLTFFLPFHCFFYEDDFNNLIENICSWYVCVCVIGCCHKLFFSVTTTMIMMMITTTSKKKKKKKIHSNDNFLCLYLYFFCACVVGGEDKRKKKYPSNKR